MRICTKPDCDCIEQAEREAGGPVKNYPCLGKIQEESYKKGSWKMIDGWFDKFEKIDTINEGSSPINQEEWKEREHLKEIIREWLFDEQDSGEVAGEIYENVVSPLQSRISELEKQLTERDKEIERLMESLRCHEE